MAQREGDVREQIGPILRTVILGGFFLGAILFIFGLYLILQGPTGETEIILFEQTFKSTSIGLGAIFIGAVLVVILIRDSLKTLRELIPGAREKESAPTIDVGGLIDLPEVEVAHDMPLTQSLSDNLSKSITSAQALEILDSMQGQALQKLHQLKLMYLFKSGPEWIYPNPKRIFIQYKMTMEPRMILDKEAHDLMRRKITEAWESDYEDRYKASEMIQRGSLNSPSRNELAKMMREYPDEFIAAFLVNEYYTIDRFYDKNLIIMMIGNTGTGAYTLNILADYIQRITPHDSNPRRYRTRLHAVQLAKEVLGSDFDSWYFSIRGHSYQDDHDRSKRE